MSQPLFWVLLSSVGFAGLFLLAQQQEHRCARAAGTHHSGPHSDAGEISGSRVVLIGLDLIGDGQGRLVVGNIIVGGNLGLLNGPFDFSPSSYMGSSTEYAQPSALVSLKLSP